MDDLQNESEFQSPSFVENQSTPEKNIDDDEDDYGAVKSVIRRTDSFESNHRSNFHHHRRSHRYRGHHDDDNHSSESDDSSQSHDHRLSSYSYRNYRHNTNNNHGVNDGYDQQQQNQQTTDGDSFLERGRQFRGYRKFSDRRFNSGHRHRFNNDRYGDTRFQNFHNQNNNSQDYQQNAMFMQNRRHRELVSVSLVDNGNVDEEIVDNENVVSRPFSVPENDRQKFRNERINKNSTLLIQKIPAHQNRIDLLNDHFQKFGSILDIKVGGNTNGIDPESALIQYSSPLEANRAYRSTEPILNNRFIKVFWANPEQISVLEKAPKKPGLKVNNNSPPSIMPVAEKRSLPFVEKRNDHEPYDENGKRFKFGGENATAFTRPQSSMIVPTKKHQIMLMKQYKERSKELNIKLNELLSNQRHLLNKMELIKSESDSKNVVENLKKLFKSNMERVNETRQAILDVQKSMKYAMTAHNTNSENSMKKFSQKNPDLSIIPDDDGTNNEDYPAIDFDDELSNMKNIGSRNMI